MGLSWQQGPLAPGAIGRFLIPDPLPDRLLFAEPLRRRMRVRFGGAWIADSEDVVLLHEPGRYPVAYFPLSDITPDVLQPSEHTTRHRDLGLTCWYTVRSGEHSRPRAAWQHTSWRSRGSSVGGCLHRVACGGPCGTGVAGSRGEGPWRRSGEAEPDLCGGGGWFGAMCVGGQRGSYGL